MFDEPSSNLDAALRVGMRMEIGELHQRLATTMVYATHDQVEAMTMADKIVVLQAGVIEQVGSPLDLYNHPRNIFVAGFIGSLRMNLLGGAETQRHNAATIGIRPGHFEISTTEGAWRGTVGLTENLGSDTFFQVRSDVSDAPLTVRAIGALGLPYGAQAYLTPLPENLHRFDQSGLRID